jgi:predicted membrane-bound spermidine synthase
VAYVARDPSTLQAASHVRAHLGGTISNRRVFTARADAVNWLRQCSRGYAPDPRS